MDKHDFLDLLADCNFKIDYDADRNASGSMVDCSTFTISGPVRSLDTFLEALGMTRETKYLYEEKESIEDMLDREMQTIRSSR